MSTTDWLLAGVFIFATESVGLVAARATAASVRDWYPTLRKPPWTPPNWLFAPVWTIMYALIGIGAYVVFTSGSDGRVLALSVFGVQLALNAGWSIVFFGLRSVVGGLVEIAFLWSSVAATMLLFFRIEELAGWLIAPYLAWVSFAAALNLRVWQLNR